MLPIPNVLNISIEASQFPILGRCVRLGATAITNLSWVQ